MSNHHVLEAVELTRSYHDGREERRSLDGVSLTDLPQASVEAHVAVDYQAYPSIPSDAERWSGRMRRVLERSAPADIIVADNAAEPLSEAAVDATNAKILFILLGLPGVLVAAALGIAAASALTESHRREDALLRLRGASDYQLVRLAVQEGIVVTAIGFVIGLFARGAAGLCRRTTPTGQTA